LACNTNGNVILTECDKTLTSEDNLWVTDVSFSVVWGTTNEFAVIKTVYRKAGVIECAPITDYVRLSWILLKIFLIVFAVQLL